VLDFTRLLRSKIPSFLHPLQCLLLTTTPHNEWMPGKKNLSRHLFLCSLPFFDASYTFDACNSLIPTMTFLSALLLCNPSLHLPTIQPPPLSCYPFHAIYLKCPTMQGTVLLHLLHPPTIQPPPLSCYLSHAIYLRCPTMQEIVQHHLLHPPTIQPSFLAGSLYLNCPRCKKLCATPPPSFPLPPAFPSRIFI
jgi:hypothetical protein